jgi:hypothetical protein
MVKGLLAELPPEDPMSVFMPEAESRLMFATSDGCLSSPALQALDSSRLDAQLDETVKAYLSHTVRLDPQTRKVASEIFYTRNST